MITRFALAFAITLLIVVPAITVWQTDSPPPAAAGGQQLGRAVITSVEWDAIRVGCERRSSRWYHCPGGDHVR
jgi:hypothetical protein